MNKKKFDRMIQLMVIVNNARTKVSKEIKELKELQGEYFEEVNDMRIIRY